MVKSACCLMATSVGLWACTADSGMPHFSTVRDSAGVRIVESSHSAWADAQRWRLSEQPTTTIGDNDDDHDEQLHRVQNAVRLSDGRIAVSNGGTLEVKYFDSDGRHLRTIGGSGSGPGEFRSLGRVHKLRGDSILAWGGRNRFTVFNSDGDYAYSATVEPPPDLWRYPSGELRPFGNGQTWARFGDDRTEWPDGLVEDRFHVVRFTNRGQHATPIGTFPAQPRFTLTEWEYVAEPVPFGATTLITSHGDRLYAGVTDRWEIGVYDLNGALLSLYRLPGAPVDLTPGVIDGYKRSHFDRARTDQGRRGAEAFLDAVQFPDVMPVFIRMVLDSDGNVWLAGYTPTTAYETDDPVCMLPFAEINFAVYVPYSTCTWSVLDSTGLWLGEVSVPVRFTVHEIGGDYVLGVWRNELDVEHIQVYDLIKP